jgi:hypothetical protein
MTPQDKAQELFKKYTIATWIKMDEIKYLTTIPTAKECSLIAVDEILEAVNVTTGNSAQQRLVDTLNSYWNKVKEEINKF